MENLAPEGEVANMVVPKAGAGPYTIPEGTTETTIYVRYKNNEAQFASTEAGPYCHGPIAWSYDSQQQDPPPLKITFMYVGDVWKLKHASANLELGPWQQGDTQQTCEVAAVAAPASNPDKFWVVTKNGDTHDPK